MEHKIPMTRFVSEFELEERARLMSWYGHKGVFRAPPQETEPYFFHTQRVALTLKNLKRFVDVRLVAAAYCHDLIEDTDLTPEQLLLMLQNQRVVDLVLQVTHVSKPEDGLRAVRRAIDRAHLAKCDADGATIKLSDIKDNASCYFNSEKWANKWFGEKRLELEVLKHGDPEMYDMCAAVLERGPVFIWQAPKP